MGRHEKNPNLHPNCAIGCPQHNALVHPPPVVAKHIEVIRALHVLQPNFHQPEDVKTATTTLKMYPLTYEHVVKPYNKHLEEKEKDTDEVKEIKKDRRWLREIRKVAQICGFDDEENTTLYIEEWVRSITIN